MKWDDEKVREILNKAVAESYKLATDDFLNGTISEAKALSNMVAVIKDRDRALVGIGYLSIEPSEADIISSNPGYSQVIQTYATQCVDQKQYHINLGIDVDWLIARHNSQKLDNDLRAIPPKIQQTRKLASTYHIAHSDLDPKQVDMQIEQEKMIQQHIKDLKVLGYDSIEAYGDDDYFYVRYGL